MVGVLNKLKLSQQPLLHIPNNIPYHSFQPNYSSKGDQANIRSKAPSITPHLTIHISHFLSLNPNFIMSPSRDQHIRETREIHLIQRS